MIKLHVYLIIKRVPLDGIYKFNNKKTVNKDCFFIMMLDSQASNMYLLMEQLYYQYTNTCYLSL